MDLLGKNIKFHNRGPSPNEGDLWLISYADMVTLLFCFFVILYSFSTIDEKKLSEVGRGLAQTFSADTEVARNLTDTGMLIQSRQARAFQVLVSVMNLGDTVEDAVDKIEKEVSARKGIAAARDVLQEGIGGGTDNIINSIKGQVSVHEDRIELAIPDGLMFKSGTAELVPEAKKALKRIAETLNKIKDVVGLEIVGHTDSSAASKRSQFPSNWALSSARAGAVAEELIRDGVSSKNMATRGMASLQPLFPERRANGTWIPENMAKNRRVHIIVKKSNEK
jgi:chemotaxis protein MotB